MKEFHIDNGPHLKSKFNTNRMMLYLVIALVPIIFFNFYKNGYEPYQHGYGTLIDCFKPLLMIIVGMISSYICEFLYMLFVLKEPQDDLKRYLRHSYAIIPGLFLGLILPVNTPYELVILGSVMATIVAKMLFGGFGSNVFNPALVGYMFIMNFFYNTIATNGGYLTKIDVVSSATPLSHLQKLNHLGSYNEVVKPFGDLLNIFVGNVPGELSALLCLVGLIFLIYKKVIKWQIPITYIMTVFVLTMIIGLSNNLGLWYPLFHILTGGLLFGAIFMATDPVTSPTTPFGTIIYGLSLGLLTVIFRFLTNYPEGVMLAILTMNIFVFIFDRIGARVRFDLKKGFIPLLCILISITLSTLYITAHKTKKIIISDNTFKVESKTKSVDNTIYVATQKGFHGPIKAQVTINKKGTIIKVNIIDQHETVWDQILSSNYIDKLIVNQNNIANVDTISGATYTSNYLKQLIIKVLNDYNGRPITTNIDTNSSIPKTSGSGSYND